MPIETKEQLAAAVKDKKPFGQVRGTLLFALADRDKLSKSEDLDVALGKAMDAVGDTRQPVHLPLSLMEKLVVAPEKKATGK